MVTWKAVEGYEGLYEVSTIGAIRSLDRVVIRAERRGEIRQTLKGKILSASRNKRTGYYHVVLCKGGKEVSHYVHRLVAEAFVPNPLGLPEVNHRDLDKSNNAADNLEWATSSGNKRHAVANGVSFRGLAKA